LSSDPENAFREIFSTGDNFTYTFFDTDTQRGQTYTYRVIVTDDADWSTPGRPASATRIDDGTRATITNIEILQAGRRKVQLTFSCRYPVDPSSFQIFRSKNSEPMKTIATLRLDDPSLKVLSSQRYHFIDEEIQTGDSLEYRILGKFSDGGFTPLTENLSIVIIE